VTSSTKEIYASLKLEVILVLMDKRLILFDKAVFSFFQVSLTLIDSPLSFKEAIGIF